MYDYRFTEQYLTVYSVLRRAWCATERALQAELAKINLTYEKLSVLWTCRDSSSTMNVTKLAAVLFRSVPTVGELLKRMEKDGLVRLSPKCKGHPSVGIELTDKGEESCRRGLEIMKVLFGELMSGVSEDQQEELLRLIVPLRDSAVEHLKMDVMPPPGHNDGEAILMRW